MSDKMREAFKIHRAKAAARLVQGDDWASAYRLADELVSWSSFEAAWQESREALVVDLPEFWDCGAGGLVIGKDELIPALEAAGLKVKP